MRSVFVKLTLLSIITTGLFCSATASATEYIHRELLGNTLPTPGCAVEAEATVTALKTYNLARFSKKFCQMQGYGWHIEEIKYNGNPVCTPCTGANAGKSQCHLEDMAVVCKRIKPGTVGMLPGKS
jgi:hypothetical protein